MNPSAGSVSHLNADSVRIYKLERAGEDFYSRRVARALVPAAAGLVPALVPLL